jgi:hypothetical protein
LELWVVGALNGHEVAVVKRDSVNVHEDLSLTGLRCGNFIERELVDTERGNTPGLHGFIRTGNHEIELQIGRFVRDDENQGRAGTASGSLHACV